MLWLERLEEVGVAPFLDSFPDSPPPSLTEAVSQFNAGEYWECHETLEELWRATPYPLRHFYQAVIKTAVGFHHAKRHNAKGGRNKLSEGLRLIGPFIPTLLALDTGSLAREVQDWLHALGEGPRVDWVELDKKPKPTIRTSG